MKVQFQNKIKPYEITLIYMVISLLPLLALGIGNIIVNDHPLLISSYITISIFLIVITILNFNLKKPFLTLIFGCHNLCTRTFKFKNLYLPICSRCTGIYVGIYLSFLKILFGYDALYSIILMLPLVIDGLIQNKTSYVSNNFRRLITGCLFGIGIIEVFLLMVYTNQYIYKLIQDLMF